jgi:hypothetical protein
MKKSDIAGRFWLANGNTRDDEIVTIKTSFDAAKATPEEMKHIEGFYSLNGPRKAKVISTNTIELRKVEKPLLGL